MSKTLPGRPTAERIGRFAGKLVLVLLDAKDRPSTRNGRSLWAVQRALEYQAGDDPNELIIVPPGFVTDLASIPRLVWSFYPPDGPWAKAAIIHDFLYFTKGTGRWHSQVGSPEASRTPARKQTTSSRKPWRIGRWGLGSSS